MKYKNDDVNLNRIIAQLKQEMSDNDRHSAQVIKNLNLEINEFSQKYDKQGLELRDAIKKLKIKELENEDGNYQKEQLEQQLNSLKKHTKNLEEDFDEEISKRNDVIRQQ